MLRKLMVSLLTAGFLGGVAMAEEMAPVTTAPSNTTTVTKTEKTIVKKHKKGTKKHVKKVVAPAEVPVAAPAPAAPVTK
jgi:hypothetical protein